MTIEAAGLILQTLCIGAWVYLGLRWRTLLRRGSKAPAPWGVYDAVLVFLLFLFLNIAPVVLLVTAMRTMGIKPPAGMAIPINALAVYASNTLTIAAILLFAARGMHPLRALGFGERPAGHSVRSGLVIFLAYLPFQYGWQLFVAAAWKWAFKEDPPQEQSVQMVAQASGAALVVMTLVAVVLAPILEELTFRAFIQRGLENAFGTRMAIVVTALVFSRLHGGTAVTLGLLPLALALGAFYARTRNIVAVIVFHAGFNAATVAFLLAARASGVDLSAGTP
jgi:hypothetical protein